MGRAVRRRTGEAQGAPGSHLSGPRGSDGRRPREPRTGAGRWQDNGRDLYARQHRHEGLSEEPARPRRLSPACGRVRLSSDVSEIKLVFSIPPHRPTPNFPPSWNVAPTDPLPVVRFDPTAGERSLDVLRWGLVPFWAKDIKVGFANINAKAEGIERKPAFREAFQRRRCWCPSIIVTSGRRPRPGSNPMQSRWRTGADGACRPMGELALAGGRMGTELRHRDDGAECLVRRASQPHAGGTRP